MGQDLERGRCQTKNNIQLKEALWNVFVASSLHVSFFLLQLPHSDVSNKIIKVIAALLKAMMKGKGG